MSLFDLPYFNIVQFFDNLLTSSIPRAATPRRLPVSIAPLTGDKDLLNSLALYNELSPVKQNPSSGHGLTLISILRYSSPVSLFLKYGSV